MKHGRHASAGPVVLLDKDGTLIEDLPYNVDPARIALAPGAAEGLPLLEAAGCCIAVVSNQAGVARGMFAESALEGVEQRLRELLADIGVTLHGFHYCPHDAAGSVARYRVACECRKPAPGLIERAARALGAEPESAWVVGDILDDVEAGRRAGCRTVLIGEQPSVADLVATDLLTAARQVLAVEGSGPRGREALEVPR